MLNKEIIKKLLYFTITVMLSSVAYYFSTGIYNCWFLTWLAPIPLFIYTLESTMAWVIFASVITYFIGFSSSIFVYSNTIIPVSLLVYGNIIDAIIFTVLLVLFRYMAFKNKHWAWSFVFASGWTAVEFITSLHSPAGTFNSIAYTQVFNLPVIQIASVTGIWGITFLLMLVPASIALSWHYRKNSKLCLKTIVVPISILILTLIFGLYRLSVPVQGPSVKIGMASINMSLEELRSRGQQHEAEKIMNRYVHCIDLLSRSGAEVILLPEKIITLNLNEQPILLQLLADAARSNQITLIATLDIQDDSKLYNSAYLFSPRGEILLKYDKQHLLPFSEGSYIPGQELSIRALEDKGIWGIAICKDMDFQEPSRGYSQRGINLLFVPALDFKADALLHARIAIMRGVEGNYAVARAAQWGLLSLSSNKGNIIDMASNSAEKNDVLLIGEIKLDQGKSIYGRFGNWFGYFSEGLFIFLLLLFLLSNSNIFERE
ncbi:apolipoprotein N-acyltransferase [Sporomusaceae bacterium BoRhaA]|uniref:apolipoprotein N-acyltransferase n=1 Tax=Pelorhabdus rhamnosifermentans TaxID=2772457 RepID=UPI001C061B96|nr:nitrilase-related carbon-nitrogen hydrolase [Pelorhabdus rhamnosifermentans]MBU2700091.1 apolipoprotein N-acyltransferase [Pelorhabdus rhamnosifermentans]